MPLIPTAVSAAACLLRDITATPRPLKIHSATNLRDADNSSSVIRHRSASASDSLEDPPLSISPIELESLHPRPSPSSPSSSVPSRPTLKAADSTSTSSTYSAYQLSPQQREKLSEQIWKGYW